MSSSVATNGTNVFKCIRVQVPTVTSVQHRCRAHTLSAALTSSIASPLVQLHCSWLAPTPAVHHLDAQKQPRCPHQLCTTSVHRRYHCTHTSCASRQLAFAHHERVGRVRLQHLEGVVDMRMARLIGPHSQDKVPHGGVRLQAPVRLRHRRGRHPFPHAALVNVLERVRVGTHRLLLRYPTKAWHT